MQMSPQQRGCMSGCITVFIVGMVLSFIAIPLDRMVFGVTSTDGSGGGHFFNITSAIALVLGIAVYFYITKPDAAVWRPIRQRLSKPKKPQK